MCALRPLVGDRIEWTDRAHDSSDNPLSSSVWALMLSLGLFPMSRAEQYQP
jgi:hypothetical protein